MKNISNNISKLLLGLLVLALFSGCDTFKKKGETTEASSKTGEDITLLTIDGKAVLKESDFNKHLNQMLQVNPYLKGAKPETLPAPLKERFFSELAKQELILAWAEKNSIEKDAEFLKSYEDMIKLVRRSLLVQAYENRLLKEIKVDEKDILDFYEKNKTKFVKEGTGGVAVLGITFPDNAKAMAFLNLARGKSADEFTKLAQKETAGRFMNIGRVNAESNCPKEIKDLALSSAKVPSVNKVLVGKNVWIIHISDKKAPEFEAIDTHKAQIENFLKGNKFGETLKNKLEELKKEFKVEQNDKFFKSPAMPGQEAQPAPEAQGPAGEEKDEDATTQVVKTEQAPATQTAA